MKSLHLVKFKSSTFFFGSAFRVAPYLCLEMPLVYGCEGFAVGFSSCCQTYESYRVTQQLDEAEKG